MPDSNRLSLAVLQACFRKHLPPILRAGLVFPGTPQLPASFALCRREESNLTMSRERCLISADPAPTPSGRGIFTRAVCPAVKRHCLPLCHRVLTLRGCRSFPAVIGRITYKAPLYRKRAAVVAGFRPLRQLFPLAEAVLGFLANLPKTERSVVL